MLFIGFISGMHAHYNMDNTALILLCTPVTRFSIFIVMSEPYNSFMPRPAFVHFTKPISELYLSGGSVTQHIHCHHVGS